MENRFEIARRIRQRKPSELLQTLKEFRKALPEGIEVIESRERNGMGECVVTRLLIIDPVLGQRQFILRVRLSNGVQQTKLGPHERFEEVDDFSGNPLFWQDMIEGQQALIDMLESQHEEPSAAEDPLPGQPAVLTERDQQILTRMYELRVVASCPMSVKNIMRELGLNIEGKHSFDNLKRIGFVAAKPNVGTFLTEAGVDAAKRLLIDPE